MSKNRIYSVIALFLMLSMIVPMMTLQTVSAHDPPWTVQVWCYVAVAPNVVGVGQETLITFWSNRIMPTASTDSRYGDRWIFYLDITYPSGTNKTLGPFTSDPVGGSYTAFTPTEVGNYTIVARMPAYKLTGLPSANGVPIANEYVNDTFGPAVSEPVTLRVQEEPIQGWQEPPIPNDYWTRPLNSANREWYVLTSNWLSGAAYNLAPNTKFAYGPGPESAHILWSRPYYVGGLMDEIYGVTGYQTMHYGGISISNMIILNGKVIVSIRNTAHTNTGWWVIDLYSGQTLAMYNDTVMPSFASIYNYESPNQHGGFPYLWRTSGVTLPTGYTTGSGLQTWELLDGWTFDTITKIANVSAGGTAVYGKDGSILRYNIATSGGTQWLTCWNSSAIPTELLGTTGTNYWQWRPQNVAVHDGRQGFSLNISLNGQDGKSLPVQGSIRWVREGIDVVGGTTGNSSGSTLTPGNLWALNLDPTKGVVGALLWNITFTPPAAASDLAFGSRPGMMFQSLSVEDGVFIFRQDLTRQYWGYSMKTGQQIWETEPESQMQFYGLSTADDTAVYEGKFISYGYGGEVTAYNITTGKIVWKYVAENQGFESPYGNYPIGIACVADGKLYLTTSEHSPTQPLFRGSDLRCINATDGSEIWKILHWSAGMAAGTGVYIADGRLLSLNSYDNEIYCYGKGPSATTVSAPQNNPTLGSSVTITGTVTDQSPSGRLNSNYGLDFSLKGTPAISDEDMSRWMEYLFMQQALPTDAKGVPVTLTAIDPNGNYINIGTVTSDITGTYGCNWKPEVPGTYLIKASFAGTKSYGPSFAQTYMSVDEPPPTASPYPQIALPDTETYILGVGIALVIAIAIGFAVTILVLRKRP
ncbi:MAG: PQQ-binding-like beta-propeller repeat protein [Candidatus Bathyarchaeota archaeon]|nr:PQQ-binding-like beta-propeller repeat protein [Candidatus Bathyarchaeota archaeon]